jgi:hypothetical protein
LLSGVPETKKKTFSYFREVPKRNKTLFLLSGSPETEKKHFFLLSKNPETEKKHFFLLSKSPETEKKHFFCFRGKAETFPETFSYFLKIPKPCRRVFFGTYIYIKVYLKKNSLSGRRRKPEKKFFRRSCVDGSRRSTFVPIYIKVCFAKGDFGAAGGMFVASQSGGCAVS